MIELSFPLCGEAVPVHVPESPEDLDHFKQWVAAQGTAPVALDTETTGLDIFVDGYRLRTVQFGNAREAWVIVYEWGARFQQVAREALRELSHLLIHNAPFDWLVLGEHAGMPLEYLARKTTDTRILATLVDPRMPKDGGTGTGLKPLAAAYIDPNAPDTQEGLREEFRKIGATKSTGWALIDVRNPVYLAYAGGDVILTARMYPILTTVLDRMGVREDLAKYEHEIARICTTMTRRGVRLDQPYVAELDERLQRDEERWLAVCRRYGVTSPNSSDQVSEALTGMGVNLSERTDSGAWKVDKAVLTHLSGLTLQGEPIEDVPVNPLAEAVYHAKRAHKWRTSYVDKFRANLDPAGRIHPFINTLQARTGRMSITGDLAAQTLPSSDSMIRRAIVGDADEVVFSVDFTAVELRVLAALADVKQMKRAIAEGRDLHDFTAGLIFGPGFTKKQRKIAKGIGFGKVYGGGPATISRQTGADMDAVKRALSAYDRAYPEIGRASRRWAREARSRGFSTVTVTGRHLPLDSDRVYAVTNYQVQSAARDVLGQALIEMDEAGLLPYLRLPIHDEVVGFAKRDEVADVVREVERCMSMSLGGVPIAAEGETGGRSWGSLYGASE